MCDVRVCRSTEWLDVHQSVRLQATAQTSGVAIHTLRLMDLM